MAYPTFSLIISFRCMKILRKNMLIKLMLKVNDNENKNILILR